MAAPPADPLKRKSSGSVPTQSKRARPSSGTPQGRDDPHAQVKKLREEVQVR